jgi:dTDP-glucose 4,6-dehydratase
MENPLARDLDYVLSRTQYLWEAMRGQRIFITGGTGFFGRWLLESFVWANRKLDLKAEAVVLTRSSSAFIAKAPQLALADEIHLLEGDVRTFRFPEGRFSYVIHAATDASVKLIAESPLEMGDTILQGTRRVLDFACKQPIQSFLFTSSGAVYGKQPPELLNIPETYRGGPDFLDPGTVYAEGKRTAELFCAIYAQKLGVPVKIGRCFAFVGPYLPLDIHFAIGNFIRDGIKGGPIVVMGDGTSFRSYLYAADLAIWLWTVLFRGQIGTAYNIGSPEAISIGDLANQVAHSFDPPIPVVMLKAPIAGKPAERYVPDVHKCIQELDLNTWILLPEAISRTIEWVRCMPEPPHHKFDEGNLDDKESHS